jgi:hypothetical protein
MIGDRRAGAGRPVMMRLSLPMCGAQGSGSRSLNAAALSRFSIQLEELPPPSQLHSVAGSFGEPACGKQEPWLSSQ